MSDTFDKASDGPAVAAETPTPAPAPTPPAPETSTGSGSNARAWGIGAAVVGALSLAALILAVFGQMRLKTLEQELVRRQQDSQGQAVEAAALSRQARDAAAAAETKVGLLEGRVAETALQRSQLEALIQQLSRSRDDNALADVEAAVRVALQQSAITGSAEPLLAALRQADERLAAINQPRTERVRRALARDIERVRAVAVADIASLSVKLDEAVRLVDELPLLSQPERRVATAAKPAKPPERPASAPPLPAQATMQIWWHKLQQAWSTVVASVWDEARGLVRVTRIDHPEAVLVAPDQAWYLRENLKLRLLNARLALISRQFDIVQSDLRDSQSMLDRYYDRGSRRVQATAELVRQVARLARSVTVPRPDESLAALAAAQAGR